MLNFYKNKKILITGGTGLIGIQLTNILSRYKAKITVVSLEKNNELPKNIKFIKSDLRYLDNCIKITKNIDYVFHLAGIKGSPTMAMEKPYEFMIPMLMFNTNMIEASRINKVKKFMFTSSIGVYQPAKILEEENVWKTFPSKNDWYAGWAKRIGEITTLALKIKNKTCVYIVRPANVFGPFDNFNKNNAMVIPSLINKFLSKEKIEILGDGKNIRDFIYSKDVARAMLFVMYKNYQSPINIGSGKATSIKNLVNIINKLINNKRNICWKKTANSGDKIRLMDVKKLQSLGFKFNYSLEEGLKETIAWYKKNIKNNKRYNAFEEK
jgi:GDP-L-fucose synthase